MPLSQAEQLEEMTGPITGTWTVDRTVVVAHDMIGDAVIIGTFTGPILSVDTVEGLTIQGLTLRGDQYETKTAGDHGIFVTSVNGITIRDVTVADVGAAAVWVEHSADVIIERLTVTGFGHYGVCLMSVDGAMVDQPAIALSSGSTDTYGIAVTHDAYAPEPISRNVIIKDGIVSDVAWEGIDTHAGDTITISNMSVMSCHTGIALVPSHRSGVHQAAPRNIMVTGCLIDSGRDDGQAGEGIRLIGAADVVGTPAQYATGKIIGNTIIDHGDRSAVTSGGIQVQTAEGVIISGNVITRPSPHGVSFRQDVRGFSMVNNAIDSPWSPWSSKIPSGVSGHGSWIIGVITGNMMTAEPHKGSFVGMRAVDIYVINRNKVYAVANLVTDYGRTYVGTMHDT